MNFVNYYIKEVNCVAKLCVFCAFLLVFIMCTSTFSISKRIVFQNKVMCPLDHLISSIIDLFYYYPGYFSSEWVEVMVLINPILRLVYSLYFKKKNILVCLSVSVHFNIFIRKRVLLWVKKKKKGGEAIRLAHAQEQHGTNFVPGTNTCLRQQRRGHFLLLVLGSG